MATKQNNKKHILFRYGLITIGFVFFALALTVKLFTTTIVEAPAWNERAKRELSRLDTIRPERGKVFTIEIHNIYSS